MKTRTDFVSNSSSSSFVLWGVSFDTGELLSKLRADGTIPAERGAFEDIEKFLEKIPCGEYVWGMDESFIAFGLSPSEMREDETLRDFKARVVDRLKSYGIPAERLSDVKFIKGVESDGYVSID